MQAKATTPMMTAMAAFPKGPVSHVRIAVTRVGGSTFWAYAGSCKNSSAAITAAPTRTRSVVVLIEADLLCRGWVAAPVLPASVVGLPPHHPGRHPIRVVSPRARQGDLGAP